MKPIRLHKMMGSDAGSHCVARRVISRQPGRCHAKAQPSQLARQLHMNDVYWCFLMVLLTYWNFRQGHSMQDGSGGSPNRQMLFFSRSRADLGLTLVIAALLVCACFCVSVSVSVYVCVSYVSVCLCQCLYLRLCLCRLCTPVAHSCSSTPSHLHTHPHEHKHVSCVVFSLTHIRKSSRTSGARRMRCSLHQAMPFRERTQFVRV